MAALSARLAFLLVLNLPSVELLWLHVAVWKCFISDFTIQILSAIHV